MAQLEQQLGELNGILKGLVPALERLENRHNAIEREVSEAKERIEGLRREIDEIKENDQRRFKDIYGKYNDILGSFRDCEGSLRTMETDVTSLKDNEKGLGQKAWDLLKIVFTTGLTALITWYLTKR